MASLSDRSAIWGLSCRNPLKAILISCPLKTSAGRYISLPVSNSCFNQSFAFKHAP